jgi:ubiquinone/menaquinone biosynthesis C-methylase UbiE
VSAAANPGPYGDLREFWEEFAPRYNRAPGKRTPRVTQWLLDRLPPQELSGRRVVDLACGAGRGTRLVAERVGPRGMVMGVDFSAVMVETAQQEWEAGDAPGESAGAEQGRPWVGFVQADAASLPFADRSFDEAICALGLMLFPDAGAALREIRRVLRPGGSLRAAVWGRPAQTTLMTLLVDVARAAGIEVPTPPRSNFHLGKPEALSAAAEGTGLRLAEHEYATLEFPFADPAEACKELGLDASDPHPRLKGLDRGLLDRLLPLCEEEAGRRLTAGGGSLTLDVMLARLLPEP